MDLDLTGRAYIVTGASSGLGRATAEALVAGGARVLLAARDPDRLAQTRAELGDAADALAIDTADPDAAQRLRTRALETFERLDGALVNTGGPPPTTIRDSTDAQWQAAVEQLFLGSVRLLRDLASALPPGGSVAIVLSVSAREPLAELGLSNGLRPGLAGVAKSLADELGPDGVRINGLLPGWILTERSARIDAADPEAAQRRLAAIPLRRYGQPEEFGRAAAFLLSPVSSFITGTLLPVDGGVLRGL